jgi:hypothetical protein
MLGCRHSNLYEYWVMFAQEAADFVQLLQVGLNNWTGIEPQRVAEAIHLMKVKQRRHYFS